MKMIWIVALVTLASCTGGKQPKVAVEVDYKENSRCKLFDNVAPFMLDIVKESIKMPVDGVTLDFDNNTYYDNVCHETIVCDNVEYCISFIKPDGTVISSFATEENAH
jgi:hypothetical protein